MPSSMPSREGVAGVGGRWPGFTIALAQCLQRAGCRPGCVGPRADAHPPARAPPVPTHQASPASNPPRWRWLLGGAAWEEQRPRWLMDSEPLSSWGPGRSWGLPFGLKSASAQHRLDRGGGTKVNATSWPLLAGSWGRGRCKAQRSRCRRRSQKQDSSFENQLETSGRCLLPSNLCRVREPFAKRRREAGPQPL